MTIELSRARELLGDTAKDMSDSEVEAIRDQLRSLAEICYESWLREQKKKKDVQNGQS